MMEIGKIQKLKVIKEKDFGIYLSDGDKADAQGVLLPKKQVPEGTKIGDELEVRVDIWKGYVSYIVFWV